MLRSIFIGLATFVTLAFLGGLTGSDGPIELLLMLLVSTVVAIVVARRSCSSAPAKRCGR